MIGEAKVIDIIIGFFKKFFQKRQQQKKDEINLLYEAYDILKELEQTWTVSSTKRRNLVDSINSLLQKVRTIKHKKNKDIAQEIRDYAKRNCFADTLLTSESKRIHKETEYLRKKLGEKLEIDD